LETALLENRFPGPEQPISEPGKSESCQSTFLAKRDRFRKERERQSSLFLGFSLCLHSNNFSQGFDELVKLDPFFVANTITIKADDLERLPVSWLHTTLKGGIRQSCVSYPLSAFLAMNSDKDFAAGHICSFPLCYHDCFTHTPRELSGSHRKGNHLPPWLLWSKDRPEFFSLLLETTVKQIPQFRGPNL